MSKQAILELDHDACKTQAMAYLVDAPFVTGQVLGVNGGFVIT